MDDHREYNVRIVWEGGEKILGHINIKGGECAVFPSVFPEAQRQVTERSLCRYLFFLHGQRFAAVQAWKAYFLLVRFGKTVLLSLEKEDADYVILTKAQADRAFLTGGHLYITERPDSCLIEDKGQAVFCLLRLKKKL